MDVINSSTIPSRLNNTSVHFLNLNLTTLHQSVTHLASPNLTWDQVLIYELSRFQRLHDRCISIFDELETALLCLGLLGNLCALLCLLNSRRMRTPSFVYHKALVLAYLIYCANFLTVKYVNTRLSIPGERRTLSYYNEPIAFYAVVVNRVITSACGYLALYTSLGISIDRFLAMTLYHRYARFNRRGVAYVWVSVSLALSVCLHSWAPWFQNEIRKELMTLGRNQTVVAYRQDESINRDRLKSYLLAKDWYNLITRFAYAVLLTALSCAVIYMFSEQQRRKGSLCRVSKRQVRRERSLFYLMIAVVILAYIQVIPREGRRILELIYPPTDVWERIHDESLPIDQRRKYLYLGLYGLTLAIPISNLCTTIERSLLFYLYFALNHSFRQEVLVLLHLSNIWNYAMVRLGLTNPADLNRRRSSDETSTTWGFRNKSFVMHRTGSEYLGGTRFERNGSTYRTFEEEVYGRKRRGSSGSGSFMSLRSDC